MKSTPQAFAQRYGLTTRSWLKRISKGRAYILTTRKFDKKTASRSSWREGGERVTIGGKEYGSIIVSGEDDEVLAVIDDEHIIEKNGVSVELRED